MKRAIAVARVSTDEQAAGDDRTSIDTQLAAIEAWCARERYEVPAPALALAPRKAGMTSVPNFSIEPITLS